MENILVECSTDLTLLENTLSDIAVLLTTLLEKLNILDTMLDSVLQLNGYFYILLFCLAGVGFFLLMYRFLKIFV